MVSFLRTTLITTALLITILNFFGLEDFSRSPYHGIHHNNLVFLGFEKDSPNSSLDLKKGDRIIAVDGEEVRNIIHFKHLTYSNRDRVPQNYTIARGDSLFDVGVTYMAQPQLKLFQKISMALTGLTFILVAFYVIIKRPDILGLLFAVNCILFSFLLTERPSTPFPLFHVIGELFYDCLFAFLPAFFLHFFLIFPGKEIFKGTRRSKISSMLYIPPTVIFLSLFALALVNYSSSINPSYLLATNGIASIYWLFYMISGVVLFIRTYMISDRVQKIKFRIATIGLIIGTVPVTIVMLLKQFIPGINIPHAYISMLFLSFISISFAYAILKHDAFDMRVVFTAGLAYIILPIVLSTLIYLFTRGMWDKFPDFPGARHFPMMVIAVVMVLIAFVLARAGIKLLVDWIFSRNRQKFREKMIEFTRTIQFLDSLEEIADFVSRDIYKVFEPEYVHIFMEDDNGNYTLRKRIPEDKIFPLTSFPAGTELICLAGSRRLPLMVEYFDRLWIKNNLDRLSIELLSILKVAVVVPLSEQNEMLGFIIIGRKRTGKPFNGADAEMLELLGERTAAAIKHNILFKVSVEKDKLEKEVHLASKIQKRLLPENPPRLESATVLGRLKNSREVGGDFFDYVEFSEDSIGLAVADVSGKGIPASLLMTTLQASFRSEATAERSPGEVLSALNKSLYKRSELSKFATFFYAIYNDTTGLLHYSNGGSYPPIIARSNGNIVKLKRGGILVGVDPDSVYSEGIVKMRPGDVIVIYTDGVIDQENSMGDYFGEEKLAEFLKDHVHLDAESLMGKLYERLLSFGEGMIKDDMTLVLLKRHDSATVRPPVTNNHLARESI